MAAKLKFRPLPGRVIVDVAGKVVAVGKSEIREDGTVVRPTVKLGEVISPITNEVTTITIDGDPYRVLDRR